MTPVTDVALNGAGTPMKKKGKHISQLDISEWI